MTRTKLLQEIRRMRFVEAYVGWQARRLTQARRRGYWGCASGRFAGTWIGTRTRAWTDWWTGGGRIELLGLTVV